MLQTISLILFWIALFLFLWTYFGYPLLMLLWAKFAPKPLQADGELEPSITILIPTYNEADVIERKLDNMTALEYPKDKLAIFVIDDNSNDGTPEIVRRYANKGVRLIEKPSQSGKMESVNIGIQEATSEIIVLSDASPSYQAHSLPILVKPFSDETVGVVVGTLAIWDAQTSVAKPAGLYWRYEAALRKWESRTGSTVAVHGNMFALRRELHRPMKNHTINDEFSIAMEVMQQGYRVVYEPDAISYDDASISMEDEFNRRVRINAGRFQALFNAGYLFEAPTLNIKFRLFSHKLLRPFSPFLMLLMLISNLLLVVTGALPWLYNFLMLGQVAFYGMAVLGWILEQQNKKIRLLNVIYYFVSSNIAALFGFWRWLRGTQAVTWRKRTADNSNESTA